MYLSKYRAIFPKNGYDGSAIAEEIGRLEEVLSRAELSKTIVAIKEFGLQIHAHKWSAHCRLAYWLERRDGPEEE